MISRAIRSALSVLVSVAMVVAMSGAAPSALADTGVDEPDVAAMKAFVGEVGTWTSGLATVGKLAEPIPSVGSSVGSVLGFPDLVQKAVADEIADLNDWDELVGGSGSKVLPFDLGDGRTGTLTVSSTGDAELRKVTFDVDVTVAAVTKPFQFANANPKFSLSSNGGVHVAATGNLTFGVGLERVSGTTFRPFLVGGSAAPSFSVDVVGTIKPTTTMKAAIGILGVDVTEGSTGEAADAEDLSVHLVGSVRDPDDDGRMYFTDPDGTVGELGGTGSLAGLASAGFRPAADGGAGKVDLDLHATASADSSLSLPGVDVGAKVSWADVSTGTPQVTLTNATSIEDFLRLSPRDLADMLGQLVSVVTAAQRNNGKNLDLPFLSGSLADAIKASEGLVQFLQDNVVQPPPGGGDPANPTEVGRPKFTSIQELFGKLNAYTGNAKVGGLTFGVTTPGYSATSHRLPFDLTIQRATSAPIDLVEQQTAAAGTATYAVNGFVSDVDLGADLVGRRVVAGASGGTIKSIAGDKRAVTLTQDWVGGKPADGTSFVVNGPAVDAGAVNLANLLTGSGGKGIDNANAIQPTAKVTPRYKVTLKLALDLSAPKTGSACQPQACPFQRDNGDGTKTLVTEQPIPVDRLLVGTGYDLVTADFPVQAGVDVFAKAGFLEVKLGGQVRVCSSDPSAGADCTGTVSSSAPPMVKVTVKSKTGDPTDGYVPIADFFSSLVDDPTARLGADTNVRGYVSGSVSVPDAAAFLPSGATAGFTASWPKVGTGSPTVQVDDLSEILAFDIDPSNPQAMLGLVLRLLQSLDEELVAGGGSGVLAQKIPVIDRSLRDFLGSDQAGGGATVTYGTETAPATGDLPAKEVTTLSDTSRSGDRAFPTDLKGRTIVIGTQVAVVRDVGGDGKKLLLADKLASTPGDGTPYFLRSELADAISLLTAAPPDSLQELVEVLDKRLGADSPVHFRAATVDGKLSLVLDLDWKKGFDTTAPVKFEAAGQTFAGASGKGTATAKVAAQIKTGLVLPLDVTSAGGVDLKVLKDSHVSIDAQGEVKGDVGANVGPVSLSLGNPSNDTDALVKAHYRLGFSGPTSGDDEAESLGAFLSGVAPTVNGYDGGVDCGLGDPDPASGETRDPLALCANLPLFTSLNGTDWTPFLSAIKMRLPKAGSNIFTPTGTVSGTDNRNRLDTPSAADLQAAFQNALLDFGVMGQGIDAFLTMIESALNEAAMEGRLPIVGGDLQAGADFVGDIREKMTALFDQLEQVNGGKLPDVATINEYLDTKLKQALTDAGANPQNLKLGLTCLLRPSDVTKAEKAGATDGNTGPTTYTYAVAAVGKFNGSDVSTKIGDTKSVGDRPATLADDKYNHVEWASVAGATSYKLLRSTAGASGPWIVVYEGSATSHDDKATTGAALTPPDQVATIDQCPGVQLTDVQGVVLRVDIGTGKVTGDKGCEDVAGKACLSKTIPLDVGIPGLSVRAQRDGGGGGLTAKLGWRAHLALELDREHGFSVLTKDAGEPEFGVGLNVDLDSKILAELAFLRIHASKAEAADPPAFAGAFQVDLRSGTSEPSCFGAAGEPAGACVTDPGRRLGLAELNAAAGLTDLVVPRLSLNLHVNWLLEADLSDTALPGVQTRLVMDWTAAFLDPAGNSVSGLDIAFEDLSINAGDFLGEVLKPIVEEIQRVTGPVQPIIDTLYAPIPVLSDLSKLAGGGDVTIVSLAKTFSTLADGPDLDFVDTIAAVITFVNKLPKPKAGEDLLIPIGSFEVSSQKAFDTPATPDTAASLIDAASKTYKKRTGPGTFTDTTDPGEVDLAGSIDAVSDKPSLGGSGSVAKGAGFAFPVLDNPGSLFNLVMGADVDLVTFDSGPLTLGFTWRQSFGPVYAPPPVFITLSGSASVTAQIQAGFDTYGLRKAFESGFDSAGSVAQILNGLYFKSADEQGNPIPVVTFYGEIAAGAAVSAVVITVGVEGGVSLTINLAWNDPNNDGKFRLFEFGAVALRNPLCLFQMSGRIGIFLRVYITLGISPFSVSFSFTLADITLLDFNVKPNCTPPPPRLAGLTEDGETLVVFAGKFGKGERGDSAWSNNGSDDDTLQVQALHDLTQQTKPVTGAKVTMLGITETFASTALKRVVVDGSSDYTGKLKVTFIGDGEKDTDETTTGAAKTGQFDLDAIVLGGSNDDTVRTGTKSSYVDGGGGKDVVTTDDQPGAGITVKVAGGGDADSIKVGDAGGTVAGDSALARSAKAAFDVKAANGSTVKITGIVDWTSIGNPGDGENGSDGNDRIAVGLGQNTVYGNGKDDAVGVAADSDLAKLPGATPSDVARWTAKPNTVVLGSGSDSLQGGSSTDTVWTGLRTAADRGVLDGAHGVDEPGADDTGATRNTVNTGAGSDTVFGSKAVDFVTGGSTTSQSDHFRGGDGDDVLIGGLGTDNLFGGPGRDWVVAEPGQVSESQGTDAFGIARTYAHSALPAGTTPSGKLLVGGDGADRVVGGDGASTLFGDRYETDACGTPVQTPESTAPAEPAAGSPGRDLVLGGAGVDKVKAGGDADLVRAFASDDLLCGQDGADEIYAGDGADTTWAGSGADKAYGEAGDDEVYGNDGEDQLYGGDQADVVEGNDGADRAFGGAQDDFVVGGTRAAGARDKGVDQLFGEAGKDVVVGDNARDTAPRYPLDLTGSDPDAGDQDVASGGADDDKVFGGLYGDTVSGNDGVDALEGNNGGDTVLGGAGSDDIIGGSSEVPSAGIGYPDGQDLLRGESGDDVAAGDNARIQRVTAGSGDAVTRGRGLTAERTVTLHDLGHADVAARYGDDDIAGGSAADVLFGQGGGDLVHGDAGSDYAEGGQGSDDVFGDADEDDLVGGGSVPYDGTGQTTRGQLDTGDRIRGGTEGDVVLGDNGLVTRGGTPHPVTADRGIATRTIQPYDLAAAAALPAVRAGNDVLLGEAGVDVVFGQAGLDRALAGAASDYAEGGPDADWLEGGDGADDLVGGSSTKDGTGSGTATAGQPDAGDVVWGQAGDDLQTGDNALVTRSGRDALTDRVSTPGTKIEQRTLQLYDLAVNGPLADPAAARFGADHLSGQEGVDVQLGQDGADRISGGGDDDYAEGQGGADLVWGDDPLQGVPGPDSWPGSASAAYDSDGAIDGQDDLLGGWSLKGYRDAGDQVRGNGAADFLLGDNGSVRRDITASTDDRRYAKRYAAGTLPTDAVKVRISGSGQPSTRFCTTVQAVCEAAGASGSDQLFGDAGDDTAYGQDGDDVVRGGADGDDLYGELGDDRVLGEDGDDAIVGDRGGIVDQYEDGTRAVTVTLNAPPAVSYTARTKGSLTRLVDLRHDVNGDAFVGNGTDPAMPYDGVDFSDKDLADGNDYLRGGAGDDSLHGGHGDDLANGDSGGDTVFGGDGADVLWGGKGCDVQTDELVADCRTDGAFDPSARGSGDRKVDYVFGGKGAVEGPSLADGGYGLDILDWRPRGTAATCTSGLWPVTVGLQTNDPCGWFEATNLDNSDAADNQHHQGVDWQYGGWDRDVMQGDVAANGPNDGDRMMDWNGAYNLYTHCNAAYGGFNDVRLHSPALQDFLQRWAYAEGAGQVLSDVTAAGTSAYNELALVYNPDNKHATGPAFSSTPGHFDDPYACSAE